jgi:hypothetical protein
MQHVLVVADWTVDPHEVIRTLSRRAAERPTTWSFVVPAWLHGLDWAGDPRASGPCAERTLLTLRELALREGLGVDLAVVGDPHPVTAAQDACTALSVDGLVLFTRQRRLSHAHPLDLAHRMHAATGLPVSREALPGAGDGTHCTGQLAAAA